MTAQLSDVGCPTLVLHRRGLDWLDITLSPNLASRIPEARLVVVDGQSPLPAAGDIDPVIGSIGEFLDLEVPNARPTVKTMEFRAVLFTDLVDYVGRCEVGRRREGLEGAAEMVGVS